LCIALSGGKFQRRNLARPGKGFERKKKKLAAGERLRRNIAKGGNADEDAIRGRLRLEIESKRSQEKFAFIKIRNYEEEKTRIRPNVPALSCFVWPGLYFTASSWKRKRWLFRQLKRLSIWADQGCRTAHGRICRASVRKVSKKVKGRHPGNHLGILVSSTGVIKPGRQKKKKGVGLERAAK